MNIRQRRGIGIVVRRFALSGSSSVCNFQTEEAPERAKRLSTIPISRLCLMFWNKFFPLLNLQIVLNSGQQPTILICVFLEPLRLGVFFRFFHDHRRMEKALCDGGMYMACFLGTTSNFVSNSCWEMKIINQKRTHINQHKVFKERATYGQPMPKRASLKQHDAGECVDLLDDCTLIREKNVEEKLMEKNLIPKKVTRTFSEAYLPSPTWL